MTTATIWLRKDVIDYDYAGLGGRGPIACVKRIFDRGGYERQMPIEVNGDGEAACEELFDLTNNPARQTERVFKYGRQRSLSTGDIVEVNTTKYVCMSLGWAQL